MDEWDFFVRVGHEESLQQNVVWVPDMHCARLQWQAALLDPGSACAAAAWYGYQLAN